ncbi:MAG: hypothetical protein ACREIF_09895 [Chthoniobacterales bacterium]
MRLRRPQRDEDQGHDAPETGPGVALEICNGRVTLLAGDVVPSGFTTGRATVRAEVHVAPGSGR